MNEYTANTRTAVGVRIVSSGQVKGGTRIVAQAVAILLTESQVPARVETDVIAPSGRPAAAQFATPSHRRPLTHGPIMSRPARRASPTSRHPVLRPPSTLIPSPRSSVVRRSYRIVARIT